MASVEATCGLKLLDAEGSVYRAPDPGFQGFFFGGVAAPAKDGGHRLASIPREEHDVTCCLVLVRPNCLPGDVVCPLDLGESLLRERVFDALAEFCCLCRIHQLRKFFVCHLAFHGNRVTGAVGKDDLTGGNERRDSERKQGKVEFVHQESPIV